MGTALESLLQRAGEIDAPPPAAAPSGGVSNGAAMPAPDQRREFGDMAVRLGPAARALHPICRQSWTDEKLRAFGEALGGCAEHYGWTVTSVVTHPMAALAMAAIPLAFPFVEPHLQAMMQNQTQQTVEVQQ